MQERKLSTCFDLREVAVLTVHLLEHLPHPFDVIMIQEPRLRVLLVLLEGDTEGIGNVYRLAVILAEKDPDDTLG